LFFALLLKGIKMSHSIEWLQRKVWCTSERGRDTVRTWTVDFVSYVMSSVLH
jgi:hypothetical protein